MAFQWIDGPQLPPPVPPVILPSNAVTVEVHVVANTVNLGGTLLYNTAAVGYDVVYDVPSVNVANSTQIVTNVSFATFGSATIGTLNVRFANITSANILSLNAQSANITTLYSPLIITGNVSADPTVPLGIASKQYVDSHVGSGGGTAANTGQLATFTRYPLPNGWLHSVTSNTGNRTAHAALFSVIGTYYGDGDGSTTFGLPSSYEPIEKIRLTSNSGPIFSRFDYASVVLADGRLLLMGGRNGTSTVANTYANTYFGNVAINTVTWTQGSDLPAVRFAQRAILLTDNRVLVIGGSNGISSRAQTYFGTISGTTITWANGTDLPAARQWPTLTYLSDGRILVTGGLDITARTNTYFGTISANTISWATGSALPASMYLHTATLTTNAVPELFITGGLDPASRNSTYFGTISANTITWANGTLLPNARYGHTSTPLADGRFLLIGGNDGAAYRAETYFANYSANTILWTPAATFPAQQAHHGAMVLNDQRIIIVSGYDGNPAIAPVSTAYIVNIMPVGIKT